jgi:GNAT superfamily N-acetyltransferase
MIRLAREDDLPVIQDIERAAGTGFRQLGMHAVAEDSPPSIDVLRSYQSVGRAWVFAEDDDRPIAYLLVELIDAGAHIVQVSVHPMHARQGIGARLIDYAQEWGRVQGSEALTLTTYVDVPWNAPYYRRLGFRELKDGDLTEGLRAIRVAEAERGLDEWPRCAMIRD